jgi:parallel beta-helix repeat protein
MSANFKASTDGTQAIIGVGGVDQMTVNNAGVVTANSFVGLNSSSVTATGSTTARTLANRFADVVNVRDFGAVGDGVTDDGPAIQLAINAASARKATVLFTGETYLIKTALEIKSNTYLLGNNGTKIFVDKNCSTGPIIAGVGRCIYTNTGVSNIVFSGIIFESTKIDLNKIVSIVLQGVTNLRIEKCRFQNFGNTSYYAQGLLVFGGSNTSIVDSIFDNNSGDGFALSDLSQNFEFLGNTCSNNLDWGAVFSNSCSNGTVANNLFLNNTSTGTGADECQNMVFSGNVSIGNEHGIRIARFGVTTDPQQYFAITSNVCRGNSFGISLEDLSINGCYTISANTVLFSTFQGIRIANSTFGSITGNTIVDSGAEAVLFLADQSTTGNATVVANFISVCTRGIRQVQSGSGVTTRIVIFGNEITGATVEPLNLLAADFFDTTTSTNFTSTNKALSFPAGLVSLTATSGAASLPATPSGFLPVYLGNVQYKIPLYNI